MNHTHPSHNTREVYLARDPDGKTQLHKACKSGQLDNVKSLLSCGVSIRQKDSRLNSPLHYACSSGMLSIVESIISHAPNGSHLRDINDMNDSGWTPLHVACYRGIADVFNYLIKKGANINSIDNIGRTALHIASYWGNDAIVMIMLGILSNHPPSNHSSSTHPSATQHSTNISSNTIDLNGDTPLHLACHEGHTLVALMLLDSGSNVNAINKDGRTPLHMACSKNHGAIVEILLTKGANLFAEDKIGMVPAQYITGDDASRAMMTYTTSKLTIF